MRNVVVGVDGTAVANGALEWAADAVGPMGTIHALAAVSPTTELRATDVTTTSDRYRQALEATLESSWVSAIDGAVDTLTTRADRGHAYDALAAEAVERDADAIVIGAHVPPLGWPRAIGRTTRRLLRDLPCPLVVVPSRTRHRLADGDPIIVGVGHGAATEAAVRWAALVAESRGLPLGLVRATGEGPVFQVDGLLDVVALYVDPAKRIEWAREDVAEMAVAAQQTTSGQISVAAATVPGLPATRLVETSKSASLLVIGQHQPLLAGQHHVTQPLRFALTHARCPVAVVPPSTEAETIDSEL